MIEKCKKFVAKPGTKLKVCGTNGLIGSFKGFYK